MNIKKIQTTFITGIKKIQRKNQNAFLESCGFNKTYQGKKFGYPDIYGWKKILDKDDFFERSVSILPSETIMYTNKIFDRMEKFFLTSSNKEITIRKYQNQLTIIEHDQNSNAYHYRKFGNRSKNLKENYTFYDSTCGSIIPHSVLNIFQQLK